MTTTTDPNATVEHLPIDVVVPDPGNRKVTLDAQFVNSIRTHGIIQPLLVTPLPDEAGRFLLVAGHRRLGAARRVGLETVPVLVRILSEQEKLELALVDNIQRASLKPSEEAVAMARIVDLVGLSASALAKRIGRSAGYVRDRLRLLELPAQARRLVDDDTLTIEDGLALTALLDQPEILSGLIAEIAGGHHNNVEWMVSRALRQVDIDAKVAAARAKVEARGVRIVEHEGHRPTTYVELGTYGGIDVDAAVHAGEPCHAVVIGPRDGSFFSVCTEKKRHQAKGASSLKAPGAAGPDAQARAERAARRQAAAQRRDFMAALVAGRMTKPDVLALALDNYLEEANSHEQAAMAELLCLVPAVDDGAGRWGQLLRDYAASSEASRLRLCLALALVRGEAAAGDGWPRERADRHRAFLIAKGYQPTAYEEQQAADALAGDEATPLDDAG